MRSILVKVVLEISELRLKISSCPEKRVVQTLASNRADQPFDEWMGERHDWHRFDLDDFQDAKVGLPLMESI